MLCFAVLDMSYHSTESRLLLVASLALSRAGDTMVIFFAKTIISLLGTR